MALDNYADFQIAVGGWLNRGDLIAAIPDFITLAEAQMLRRIMKARNEGQMLPRAMVFNNNNFVIAAGVEYVSLPSDFLGPLSFSIDADAVQLDYISPENLVYLKQKRGITASPDVPGVYTIVGTQFQFLPVPDQNYAGNLFYWQKPAPLSNANPSNWILANHPDVYLYGALTQSAPYLMDDARMEVWGGLFTAAIEDMLTSDPLPNDRSWLRMESGLTFRPNSTTTFNINTGDFTYGP
jgi:hypothetical protein